jgi:hypothetical protein
MAGLGHEIRPVLVRAVLEAAGRRYSELTDYLAGRRLRMPDTEPHGQTSEDDDNTPL